MEKGLVFVDLIVFELHNTETITLHEFAERTYGLKEKNHIAESVCGDLDETISYW
jgi:hypothetical protein